MQKKQCGASMVEYLVGLSALAIVLLLPIPPSGENVFSMLEKAIKKEHSAYVYASSLPRVSDDGSLLLPSKGKKKKK